jgi:hypothetical protein
MISCLIRPAEKVIVAFLITFILLFSFGCFSNSDSGSSGKKSNEKTAFAANDTVTFTAADGSTLFGTMIDLDEDGNSDITVISVTEVNDTTAPEPGNSGLITPANVLGASLTLNWTKATDNSCPASFLKYKIVQSINDNIDTITDANTAGSGRSIIQDWSANINTLNVSGLSPVTKYYFVVLIKDAAGNMAIYQAVEQTTIQLVMTGDWIFMDGETAESLNYDTSQDATNPRMAVFESKLYAAWSENYMYWTNIEVNRTQIRVKQWNGTDWSFVDGSSDTGLNYDNSHTADFPQMISFDSKLYAAWSEFDGSDYLIRVKEWDGTTWTFVDGDGAEGLVYDSSPSTAVAHPQMIQYQSRLYIIWEEENSAVAQKKQIRIKQAEMEQ